MKEYLSNYFTYNSWANIKLLKTVLQLPDKTDACNLFSHLINAQNKWLNRVSRTLEDTEFDWQNPLYEDADLLSQRQNSVGKWQSLLAQSSEEQLENDVLFKRQSDNKTIKVKLSDLMFQLNCHSVHHRAQINKLISAQGVKVPQTDYIFTVLEVVD